MNKIVSTLILAAAVVLSSCSQEATETADTTASTSGSAAEAAPAPTLPDGFFLAEAPADAVPLSQAREAAQAGDDIAFTGYIGGRSDPFTEGRALFLVTDVEQAPACGDECAVPWDACCIPNDVIAANSATVQVVDDAGQTLRLDLNGQNGLAPGSQVAVLGKVREANDAILIVDAQGIKVETANAE